MNQDVGEAKQFVQLSSWYARLAAGFATLTALFPQPAPKCIMQMHNAFCFVFATSFVPQILSSESQLGNHDAPNASRFLESG